jgi:hypothetical protein
LDYTALLKEWHPVLGLNLGRSIRPTAISHDGSTSAFPYENREHYRRSLDTFGDRFSSSFEVGGVSPPGFSQFPGEFAKPIGQLSFSLDLNLFSFPRFPFSVHGYFHGDIERIGV